MRRREVPPKPAPTDEEVRRQAERLAKRDPRVRMGLYTYEEAVARSVESLTRHRGTEGVSRLIRVAHSGGEARGCRPAR
jgi:hypothetical protein